MLLVFNVEVSNLNLSHKWLGIDSVSSHKSRSAGHFWVDPLWNTGRIWVGSSYLNSTRPTSGKKTLLGMLTEPNKRVFSEKPTPSWRESDNWETSSASSASPTTLLLIGSRCLAVQQSSSSLVQLPCPMTPVCVHQLQLQLQHAVYTQLLHFVWQPEIF